MKTTKWALECMNDLYKKADLENEETLEQTSVEAETLNPALTPYTWLLDGLSIITGKDVDDNFTKEFEIFVLKNKSKIDKATSNNGFSGWLGKGRDGVVAQLNTGFAFKIFTDIVAFNDAKAAMERLHSDPSVAKTEAMIYDVGVLGTFFGKSIYYYLIEKMTTVSSLSPEVKTNLSNITKSILIEIQDFKREWEVLKQDFSTPEKRENAKRVVYQKVKDITKAIERNNSKEVEYFNMNAKLQLKSTWLSSLVEEIIMKFLTNRTDVHFGNIGITNFGEFRYFDPSAGNALDRIMNTINRKTQEEETLIVGED